jgi:hypothetical protein
VTEQVVDEGVDVETEFDTADVDLRAYADIEVPTPIGCVEFEVAV